MIGTTQDQAFGLIKKQGGSLSVIITDPPLTDEKPSMPDCSIRKASHLSVLYFRNSAIFYFLFWSR